MILTRKQILEQLRGVPHRAKRMTWTICGEHVTHKMPLVVRTIIAHGTECTCCGAKLVGAVLSKAYSPHGVYPIITFYAKTHDGRLVKLTCDHIIPKSKGGDKTAISNLQLMCFDCNQTKGDWLPSELIFGKNYLTMWLEQMKTGDLAFEDA